jgi:ceramide glucosyltransferase
LVNCFYRLANPATLAMRCEAVAVNADFWSQVLQSRDLKPLDFALGAVMAVRREALEQIGGFAVFADHLADDYQLGNRVARAGWRIELCPVVVECWDPPKSWRAVWAHQLRWARTIRVCQPLPYFFSILSNATLWPLGWALYSIPQISVESHRLAENLTASVTQFPPGLVLGSALLALRVLIAHGLQRRLTQSNDHTAFFWLVPVKDLVQAVVWLLAFAGNRIEWRGERYRLQRDGRLVKT